MRAHPPASARISRSRSILIGWSGRFRRSQFASTCRSKKLHRPFRARCPDAGPQDQPGSSQPADQRKCSQSTKDQFSIDQEIKPVATSWGWNSLALHVLGAAKSWHAPHLDAIPPISVGSHLTSKKRTPHTESSPPLIW